MQNWLSMSRANKIAKLHNSFTANQFRPRNLDGLLQCRSRSERGKLDSRQSQAEIGISRARPSTSFLHTVYTHTHRWWRCHSLSHRLRAREYIRYAGRYAIRCAYLHQCINNHQSNAGMHLSCRCRLIAAPLLLLYVYHTLIAHSFLRSRVTVYQSDSFTVRLCPARCTW